MRALSRLELESVDDALASVGARVDPAPAGKTIGRIIVVNQDVFSKRDWYFQFFNIFHRTTRGYIIERELLLKPGQPWDQALVEESTRNLQVPVSLVVAGRTLGVPELSSVVVMLPVVSPVPGQVDLLVVTRDVWSLRFNTNFEYQGNALTLIETSLSENNLFGWRKFLSVRFNRDQGTYNYGPDYFDPNIHGTRLVLRASALFYTSRETGNYEGDAELVSLHYPLYSLATKWGGGVDVIHQNVVFRGFRGNSLRLVDLAGTPDVEMLPYEYRRHVADRRQQRRAVVGQRRHPARDGRLPGRWAQLRRAARLSRRRADGAAVPARSGRRSPSRNRNRTCATRCSRPATW